MTEEESPVCSFCGAKQDEVDHLVVAENASICDTCIMSCLHIVIYGEGDEENSDEKQTINLG